MLKKIFKRLDYGLIIIVLMLFAIGITALYSANGGEEGDLSEVYKQLAWFGVGIMAMMTIIIIDYEIIRKVLDTAVYNNYNIASSCFVYKANKWGAKLV